MVQKNILLEIQKHIEIAQSKIAVDAANEFISKNKAILENETSIDFGGSCGYAYLIAYNGRHPVLKNLKQIGLVDDPKKPYYIDLNFPIQFSQCLEYNLFVKRSVCKYLNENLANIFFCIYRVD